MDGQRTCITLAPDAEGPHVVAFVGPNGSGKSSVINLLRIRNVAIGDERYAGTIVHDEASGETLLPLVNPDEIAKAIKAENPALAKDECNRVAFERANAIRGMLARAGLDFGFETVGSHVSKAEFLEGLKEMGYYVAILFISTGDPQINLRRVAQRRHNGGHDVPRDKVISRYARTMELLPRYYNVADQIAIYDNSEDHVQEDGAGPRLLLLKRDGTVSLTEDGLRSVWLRKSLPCVFA